MTRIRVLPYKQGSKSAKALATALGGKVIKLDNCRFKPKEEDIIINWGNTTFNDQAHWGDRYALLNDGDLILCASNKKLFFKGIAETNPEIIPPFWTNKQEIPENEYPIVCRSVLAGHSGAGITISSNSDDLVNAPLYVKYIKKKDEYRVHCGKDWSAPRLNTEQPPTKIIAVQRKARRADCENPNWQIRNHSNGFVYVRSDVNPPQACIDVALKAFELTSLDFGAVDVIWNAQQERAYVLEINTAPGLEGQTISDYAGFFHSLV